MAAKPATTNDPQVTKDRQAAQMLTALARAIEVDGMPRPAFVSLEASGLTEIQIYGNTGAGVDDWAALLSAPAKLDDKIHSNGSHHWRNYSTTGALDGLRLRVWCGVKVDSTALEVENEQLRAELAALKSSQVAA